MSSSPSLLKAYFRDMKKWRVRVLSKVKRIWEVNFFFSNILVPVVVLALYFGSLKYFLSSIFSITDGVNYVFASRSWEYISVIALVCSFVFLVVLLLKKGRKITFKKPWSEFSGGDFFLLLLPLTPILQYIINNQDALSPLGSVFVFFFFVLFSCFYVFAIPAIFGMVGSTRTLITLGLAFVFAITSMASLTQIYAWFGSGSFWIQWMFLGGVFLVTWSFYGLSDKKLLRVLVAVVFVSNSIMQLRWTYGSPVPVVENKLLSHVGEKLPESTPSIYLMIYDAYVSNETMLAHGIDNSSQEEYLIDRGFELYPHTYSVARLSTATMSRVLNVSMDYYGKSRRAVSGDGVVQNLLKGVGYKTYGLFPNDFFFLEIGSSYDFSIPGYVSSPDVFLRAVLIGEFRFDVGFRSLPREEFVETKQNIFKNISQDLVFIYMHSNLPGHSQNSGACLPDEIDQYETRLSMTNIEMQQDINIIIENDPEAIIIVAGDHGPYLTKNCADIENKYDVSEISRLDIQDRYGTFLAIRWPTEEFVEYDDITVLQDIFPAIFAYLYKDIGFLESKIEPSTISPVITVQDGMIYGGINDGEPLFITDK
jgi:hypothetical protein